LNFLSFVYHHEVTDKFYNGGCMWAWLCHIWMRLVGTCGICWQVWILCYTLFWARFMFLQYVVKVVNHWRKYLLCTLHVITFAFEVMSPFASCDLYRYNIILCPMEGYDAYSDSVPWRAMLPTWPPTLDLDSGGQKINSSSPLLYPLFLLAPYFPLKTPTFVGHLLNSPYFFLCFFSASVTRFVARLTASRCQHFPVARGPIPTPEAIPDEMVVP
jgi:hypothetical protein